MKIRRLMLLIAMMAVIIGVTAVAASADSVASALCANDYWRVLHLPDGSPANFKNNGACVSAIQRGQAVLILTGTVGDPASGNYEFDGIVVDSSGTVESWVVGAGPALTFCASASVYDLEDNLLATGTVNAPGQLVSVPLTGMYFHLHPGKATVTNVGGTSGGNC